MHCNSFPPAARADARLLILGSMPGTASLRAQQYYAHPRNLFWPFMGALFGAGPELPYAQRLRRLHAQGIAIWDVLAYCERPGSLDGRIVRASEMPNDFVGFLRTHRQLERIVLNGGKAAEAFARHISRPQPALVAGLQIVALPSTSPANASQPAAAKLQRWRAAGHTALVLSVNLSARQVEAPALPRLVQQVLDDCQLPAPSLELEITETALLHNADPVRATLQALKDLGVALALDDFGTGYSSLSHLRRFPIDTIKIDKSFTAEIGASADTATIVRAIVALARSLGVETVAEGVETAAQLRFLALLGCHHAQGYHLGRPVPAAAIDALLALPPTAWREAGAALAQAA